LIVIFTTSTVFIVFIILQLPFTYVSHATPLIILEYYKGGRGLADAVLGARGWAAWVVVGVLIGAGAGCRWWRL
jgi:hypothetical protein